MLLSQQHLPCFWRAHLIGEGERKRHTGRGLIWMCSLLLPNCDSGLPAAVQFKGKSLVATTWLCNSVLEISQSSIKAVFPQQLQTWERKIREFLFIAPYRYCFLTILYKRLIFIAVQSEFQKFSYKLTIPNAAPNINSNIYWNTHTQNKQLREHIYYKNPKGSKNSN